MISGYATLEKLKEIVSILEAKQLKGFAFTASVDEESNQYGQNVSFFAEQDKATREAKTPKYYFGNGKVFWTDGKITLGTKEALVAAAPAAGFGAAPAQGFGAPAYAQPAAAPVADRLPF